MLKLPTEAEFTHWLSNLIANGDNRKRNINYCSGCYLTEFLRAYTGNYKLNVSINSMWDERTGRTLCETPEWMMTFQCNAIFQPGWTVYRDEMGKRHTDGKEIDRDTRYTPGEALDLLAMSHNPQVGGSGVAPARPIGRNLDSCIGSGNVAEVYTTKKYFDKLGKGNGSWAKCKDGEPVVEKALGSTKQLGTYRDKPVYSHGTPGKGEDEVYVVSTGGVGGWIDG